MATKKQVEARNQSKQRGKPANPVIGNFNSVLNAIQHVQDKVHSKAAKDLEDYYEMMENLAKGKGDFAKAGIKDRVMAVKWHIELADKFLNEYYESQEEEDEGVDSHEKENYYKEKSNGTTGGVSLISDSFSKD